MLELYMAIQPRLVLEPPWQLALSTLDHAPVTIAILDHARTSLYQQLPATPPRHRTNKKPLQDKNHSSITCKGFAYEG
jgi:hypothetical protein